MSTHDDAVLGVTRISPVKGKPGSVSQTIPQLDAWRALSILLVLSAHLLPLGPKSWRLNESVAATGMAIFFTLSGFLITRLLIRDDDVRSFLVRRLMRILPLAWLGMLMAFAASGTVSLGSIAGNLLFYANLPPFFLVEAGGHFWSLCLEIQFYICMAALVAIGHRRGLLLIPVACVAITCGRIYWDEPMSIVSWFRADELLAGATLALVHEKRAGAPIRQLLGAASIPALFLLLVASADLRLAALPYLRPYLAAAMVGASLYNPPAWLRRLCEWRFVTYIAAISYALYVFHGVLAFTWLGSGQGMAKYAKRPLLFAAVFLLAHLSTFHYEKFWNDWARRLTRRPRAGLRQRPAG